MSAASGTSGSVVTFYSYKGGTGRTMALANAGWLLADMGYRVCLVDWDLEAPGLHRYFSPFLVDPRLESTPGVIDFAWRATEPCAKDDSPVRSREDRPDRLVDYAVSLSFPFAAAGSLDLIGAGRQDDTYGQRVTSFDWDDFYARLSGGVVLERAMRELRDEYQFILIDSRTGVSDTSGICTIQFPDALVACYTLNRQSIEGVANVLGRIVDQRNAGSRPVDVIPVEMRVETSEKERLDVARRESRDCMARFRKTSHVLEVPYWPFYAFEEVLAPFFDDLEHRSELQLLTAMEHVTNALVPDRNVRARVLEPELQQKYARQFLYEPEAEGSEVQARVERLHDEVVVLFEKWLEQPRARNLLSPRLLDQLKLVTPPRRVSTRPEYADFIRASERNQQFAQRAVAPLTVLSTVIGGFVGALFTFTPLALLLLLLYVPLFGVWMIVRSGIARPRTRGARMPFHTST